MSNQQTQCRSGGCAVTVAVRWKSQADEELNDADSGDDEDSVYAFSSSSSGRGSSRSGRDGSKECRDGSGSSCDSSLYSCDSYIYAADSCCTGSGGHYEQVCGDVAMRHLLPTQPAISYPEVCPYSRNAAVVAVGSSKFSPIRCRWSSLLCGVSILLGASSLSSMAVCIALTGISISCLELSRITTAADSSEDSVQSAREGDPSQINRWTEHLMQQPLTDHESPSRQRASQLREPAKWYGWDCFAYAGHTKCSPVQKAHSRRGEARSSRYHQYRRSATDFHVPSDGVYHVCIQIVGIAWQTPPTLLRALIARITPKSGVFNVTAAHTNAEEVKGGALRKGAFSVYTATTMLLRAGDKLQARIICIEEPACIVHVNGTASYLTLERLER